VYKVLGLRLTLTAQQIDWLMEGAFFFVTQLIKNIGSRITCGSYAGSESLPPFSKFDMILDIANALKVLSRKLELFSGFLEFHLMAHPTLG